MLDDLVPNRVIPLTKQIVSTHANAHRKRKITDPKWVQSSPWNQTLGFRWQWALLSSAASTGVFTPIVFGGEGVGGVSGRTVHTPSRTALNKYTLCLCQKYVECLYNWYAKTIISNRHNFNMCTSRLPMCLPINSCVYHLPLPSINVRCGLDREDLQKWIWPIDLSIPLHYIDKCYKINIILETFWILIYWCTLSMRVI